MGTAQTGGLRHATCYSGLASVTASSGCCLLFVVLMAKGENSLLLESIADPVKSLGRESPWPWDALKLPLSLVTLWIFTFLSFLLVYTKAMADKPMRLLRYQYLVSFLFPWLQNQLFPFDLLISSPKAI